MSSPFVESVYRLRVFIHRFRRRLFYGFLIPFTAFVAMSSVPVPRYTAEAVLMVRLGPAVRRGEPIAIHIVR